MPATSTTLRGLIQVLGHGSNSSFCVLSQPDRPRFSRYLLPADGFRSRLRRHWTLLVPDTAPARAPLRTLEHGPLIGAGLHQVTIGSRVYAAGEHRHFADYPALPNNSFKPTPLRGFTFALALR